MIKVLKEAAEAFEIASKGGGVNFYAYAKELRQAIAELESQEPVAWVDLLKKAEEVVRSKPLWKKYIDGTPLANDIAVWMANFAQEHSTPQQRPWVGLTEEERAEIQRLKWWDWEDTFDLDGFTRAIEAKLKEKNT